MNYKFDGSRVFFTSDTHFNHTNIIRFCNRPFKDVAHMNETIIANWNSVVGPDDIIFHLGDFCLGGSAEWINVLNRLNGKIYLIAGNHDIKNLRQNYTKYFEQISMQMHIEVDKQKNLSESLSLPLLWRSISRYMAAFRACTYQQA